MEALVRIRHPQQGLIPASDFIEIAEHAGLVTEIDSWVLPEAMRQYADWSRKGLNPVRIAVNISRLDLSHASIFERALSTLSSLGLGPDALQLELTETAAVLGGDASFEVLGQLAKEGISLALDDFGRGYSSLSCLHGLPVDTVKLDRSFVSRLSGEADSTLLLSAMIAAARALRMHVIAEGVETEAQELVVRSLGCDALQGHYIARPLNAVAAEQLLADRMRTGQEDLTREILIREVLTREDLRREALTLAPLRGLPEPCLARDIMNTLQIRVEV
jgi:EAL domain-containing protein (putative c-di-GMP-specific phosphodiesterase class I)